MLSEVNVNGKNINYYYENNNLLREDNRLLNVSQGRSYYGNGNISTYTKGAYQTNNGGNVSGTTTSYTYSGDRMMSYGNQACEYDNMGNPTTYRGKSATWKGRQMLSFGGNTFTYDGQGRRISKNSLTFFYDSNGNIIKQSNGLEFFYDFEGVVACKHNGNTYIYVTDAQGNVIALIDNNGNTVVEYLYDAWGNHKVVDENGDEITSSTHIGNLNPFRYRGYYYDTETGLYFLQTRYYDPEVGRFLNRDSVQYADPETINGLNLYAYCLNNPVEYADPTGHFILTTLIVAGLATSFVVGFATSTISQGIQYGWDEINWWQSLVDGLFATASAALAATGIGVLASIGIGAALGFGQYVADSAFHDQSLSLEGALSAIILGGIAGRFSGAGALNGKALAKSLSYGAANSIKSLTATLSRYATNALTNGIVALKNIVNNNFIVSIVKIGGSTVLTTTLQSLLTNLL